MTKFLLLLYSSLLSFSLMAQQQLDDNQFNSSLYFRDNFQDYLRAYNAYLLQDVHWIWGVTLGAHLELGGNGHSGIRFFTAASFAGSFLKGDVKSVGAVQTELELYRGGLGNTLLKSERDKFNLEWRNSFQMGLGTKFSNVKSVYGRPLMPEIGQGYSTLYDPLDLSLSIGTSFITGLTHKRHQQLGFFKGGVMAFDIYYMNDGPPFGKVGLGDTYDRYWTGVGGLGFYWANESPISSLSLKYTRFTGDEPFVYELGSIFGLNYLPHKKSGDQFFNKGRYQYRLGLYGHTNVGVSIYQPKRLDVQDLIHYNWIPFHSNPTGRYWCAFGDHAYRQIWLPLNK